MGGPSYTPVPGSDRLRTQKRGASTAAPVLAAEKSAAVRVDVDIDGRRVSVGRVLVHEKAVPLRLDVVDRLFPLLEPEELAIYVHLYRLALADEKNICRVSRAELVRRTRLADRRLGRALAGLVAKRAVDLVDRDRDGTLYRIALPDELDAPAQTSTPTPTPTTTTPTMPASTKTSTTTSAKTSTETSTKTSTNAAHSAATNAVSRAHAKARSTTTAATAATRATTTETTTETSTEASTETAQPTTTAATDAPRSVGAIAAWFVSTHGAGPGRQSADVVAAVLEMLEEGFTFATIPPRLTTFVQKAPKTTPLRDWQRY